MGVTKKSWFPRRQIFEPLIADQRTPRFHLTYQSWDAEGLQQFNAGVAGLGGFWGIREWPDALWGGDLQVGFDGFVQSIFNLDRTSLDLINSDFTFGVPVSWRKGDWSVKVRVEHLSSHVGDEFLLDNPIDGFQRFDFSYEGVTLIGSRDLRNHRIYAGWLYLATPDLGPSPRDLAENWFQAGWEYRWKPSMQAWGIQAGVDVQAWEELDYQADVSVKSGVFWEHPELSNRSVALLVEYYNGRVPYGQFFDFETEYGGFSMVFGF